MATVVKGQGRRETSAPPRETPLAREPRYAGPLQTAPRVPVSRARRRPALLALGVVLVVLGVLSGAWMIKSAGERVSVLAIARPVPFGAVITAEDLIQAEVSVDANVSTVPAGDIEDVVGLVAATNLTPGALLTRGAVTNVAPPAPGQVLVALALPTTRMPARPLEAGDKVLVVDTPTTDADAPALPPSTIPATVVRLGEPDLNGVTVVDVTVVNSDGPALAARSATGRIALVVQPRGH